MLWNPCPPICSRSIVKDVIKCNLAILREPLVAFYYKPFLANLACCIDWAIRFPGHWQKGFQIDSRDFWNNHLYRYLNCLERRIISQLYLMHGHLFQKLFEHYLYWKENVCNLNLLPIWKSNFFLVAEANSKKNIIEWRPKKMWK